jgi:large subunit ribosomal protein L15
MKLNDLRDNPGARKSRVRVGRGIGSGLGKTGGRGQKGQKSRSGVSVFGFEGGQMPLHMRLPKRGFNNIFAKDYAEVNLGAVQKAIDAGKLATKGTIDHDALKAAGLARGGKDGVRLLGKGAIGAKLAFRVAGVSAGARQAVEAAGGSVELIEVIPASEKADAKKGTIKGRFKGKPEEKAKADAAAKAAAAAKAEPKAKPKPKAESDDKAEAEAESPAAAEGGQSTGGEAAPEAKATPEAEPEA